MHQSTAQMRLAPPSPPPANPHLFICSCTPCFLWPLNHPGSGQPCCPYASSPACMLCLLGWSPPSAVSAMHSALQAGLLFRLWCTCIAMHQHALQDTADMAVHCTSSRLLNPSCSSMCGHGAGNVRAVIPAVIYSSQRLDTTDL